MTDTNDLAVMTPARWVDALNAALAGQEMDAVTALFTDECFWRDLVAFTWTIRTMEGKEQIANMLRQALPEMGEVRFTLKEDAPGEGPTSDAWLIFETGLGRGEAHLRLLDGRCWTLLTALKELKGHEETAGARRPRGVQHQLVPGRPTWSERRRNHQQTLGIEEQPYVLIVGGGQGGLALGARLKQLGVPTLIVDRLPRVGDQWRSRYKSLALHDPVWYDHMPYLPFPDTWPVFTPKDKLGDWMEYYASIMELDVWTSSECVDATFDELAGKWRVTIDRDGKRVELNPEHLVLATGNSGFARMPEFDGAEEFSGEILHSSTYPGGDGYAGRSVVVIGANNSAHDICGDLWEHGASVTMVQRSSTLVVRSDTIYELTVKPLYSEEALAAGITTERADMLMASLPARILPDLQRPAYDEIRRRDAAYYEALEKAGFLLDFGEDGSGLYLKYLRRASGYYIDTGASPLIADGRVALRSPVEVERFEAEGVRLTSGELLPCDTVICATGFGSMDEWAARLISPEVAEKVGKCWGYGSDTINDPGPWEGELRNMWKPTAQQNLWFHGGNLQQSRHYSRYLALQLKARMEKLPVQVIDQGQSNGERA